MKIVWSKNAKKEFFKIDGRYQRRIKAKLAELDDRSAPRPDIKKISATENQFRLRVGDYRILITLRDDPDNHCYVLAVKHRTSTTYLHEEKAPYGCSAN
ncbi:type II toxin-antitoxin system RelE family toxin [Enterobacter asburiae]|uniref:Type II toxin-antitoxin system RelE/ParE family toxin n=1 Tax=Enterobacter asburiae TaxID=61645 RepID=A0ABU6KQB3_ENTAS|nr:type II toxin-antitoxin system RelE/ParE family toxin [Enterobacter asburiae]GJJ97953.1 plasmid stabilization protein [Enterobacter cloacae]MCK1015272.1 type II toxin-antitoxin system RelE/ParE family toxin [Enterobacter asburiae]MDU2340280.1 type II toxin-antitoxin system RelE/ParE family toxin [Enterobacter asburiae]MEC5728142.1 type II toxin-antitoxin system RelE/ParE family toxin [Enterobacter asburiae]MEC5860032.1 type II toxin-antitoxin system RelE/ParE family toxin [Enterobacter asbu